MNSINELIEAKRELDDQAIPLKGRKITLHASDFRKEFKVGMRQIVGFDICWMDDLNE